MREVRHAEGIAAIMAYSVWKWRPAFLLTTSGLVVNSYAGIKPSSPDSTDSGLQELPAVAISIAELGELGPRANRCDMVRSGSR